MLKQFLLALALLLAPLSADAAIAYRAGAAHNETDPTTSATATIPSSVATDDVCFAALEDHGANADEGTASISDNDSGGNSWASVILQGDAGSDESDGRVWWKRATSGTASKTVTITATGETSVSLIVDCYSGAKTSGTPFESVTGESNLACTTTCSHGGLSAITPSANNAWILAWTFNGQANTNPNTWAATAPTTLTERQYAENNGTTGVDCSLESASDGQTTATAVGNITWSQGTNAANASVALILLEQTGGGGATGPGKGTLLLTGVGR